MKICLINPQGKSGPIFQPLGLAYLAAVLENDYDIKVVDLQIQSLKEALRFKPDIVGITIPYSASASEAFKIARTFKNCKVIIGGTHASVKPEECLKYADCVVIGEGEEVLPKIIEQDLTGIIKAEPINDLDSLPFPARHLLPMKKYFQAAKSGSADRATREPWTTIFTSRGCPYDCIFCCIHLTMGKKWRARSPVNVVDEIEEIIKDFNIHFIRFEDDNLTLDPKRMYKICDLIIDRGLHFKWNTPNGVRADTLDRDLLLKMKEAGCFEIWFAPESGVQRVVDEIIGKKLDLNKLVQTIKVCKEIELKVHCFFVIGLVGETIEDAENTMKFAYNIKKLGAIPYINMACPLYGTRLYREAKKLGCLKEYSNDDLLYNNELYLDTPQFPAKRFYKIYKKTVDAYGNARERSRALVSQIKGQIKGQIKEMLRGKF